MHVRWLLAALLASLLLAVLHFFALSEYLYWRLEWFDVFMHYLGGVAIATLLVALIKKFRPLAFVLVFALLMIAWEVFEYVFGIPKEANYKFDTSLDVLMDALGALTVYTIARLSLWR